jgi:hypothetical protein
VIILLTQKLVTIVMGLINRVKARASRSKALTRLLKPAPRSASSRRRVVAPSVGGCQGGRSHRKAGPRSGILDCFRQTINNRYSTLVGTAVTKVRHKPLLFTANLALLVQAGQVREAPAKPLH